MDNQDLQFIQNQIGYEFKNTDLLQQAFVRRSYSKENGGEDNEVLEFIGDTVLGMVVVKILTEEFGFYTEECNDYDKDEDFNEFCCEYSEGKLTEFKKRLVGKKTLAKRVDDLGISDYLIMGKGDEHNHIERQESVKEDLFEAIVGAVALDSKWDFDIIYDVVKVMLNPDFNEEDNNYVELIQEWVLENSGDCPLYHYEQSSYSATWYIPFQGISQNLAHNMSEWSRIKYYCLLNIGDDLPVFRGFGESKSEARKNACKVAYDYLEEKNLLFTIQDEIENPNRLEAINQLETLARRGYFSIPTYKFEQLYDENGNPIWQCNCYIKEKDYYYSSTASSKKEAKKNSAFLMLKEILDIE